MCEKMYTFTISSVYWFIRLNSEHLMLLVTWEANLVLFTLRVPVSNRRIYVIHGQRSNPRREVGNFPLAQTSKWIWDHIKWKPGFHSPQIKMARAYISSHTLAPSKRGRGVYHHTSYIPSDGPRFNFRPGGLLSWQVPRSFPGSLLVNTKKCF